MRYFKRALAWAAVVMALTYVGDDLAVRLPIPRSRNPYGTVDLTTLYAIPEKNRKTEFVLGDPQRVTCVHSLLPHFGYSPCWYVERKKMQRIDE
jgi:hypothetical protein